jgi:hypothetical protein
VLGDFNGYTYEAGLSSEHFSVHQPGQGEKIQKMIPEELMIER